MEKITLNGLVITGLILFNAVNAIAQDTYFSKVYKDLPRNDEGHDVMPLSDGGFLLTGANGNSNDSSYQAVVMRLDSAGNMIWQSTIGGNAQVGGNEITATPDGNYFIAGHTQAFGWGECDALYILINSSGDTLWTTTYGTVYNDAAYGCMMAPDGNYFAVGLVGSNAAYYNGYIQKISPQGDTLWTQIYGGPYYNYFDQVRASGDGNLFVSGITTVNSHFDFWLVKMDPLGRIIWSKTYGTPDDDISYGMRMAPDGGCLMVGKTVNFLDSVSSLYYVRTDKNGDTLWTKSIPNVFGCSANSTEYINGEWLITGEAYNPQHFSQDAYLARMDDNGDVKWTEYFGGMQEDNSRRLSLCNNGDVIFTGYSYSYGTGENDIYLVRTAADGLAAAGISEISKSGYLTIQPNPFNNSTLLRFPADLINGQITIYDMYGRILEKTNDTQQGLMLFERQGLPAGVYMVQLSDNDKVMQVKKIVAE